MHRIRIRIHYSSSLAAKGHLLRHVCIQLGTAQKRRVPPWRNINGASRSNVAALSAQPCSAIQRSWGRSAAAVSLPQMRTAILNPVGSTMVSSRQASHCNPAATAASIASLVWECRRVTGRGARTRLSRSARAPMRPARATLPAHGCTGVKQSIAAADSTSAAAARMLIPQVFVFLAISSRGATGGGDKVNNARTPRRCWGRCPGAGQQQPAAHHHRSAPAMPCSRAAAFL